MAEKKWLVLSGVLVLTLHLQAQSIQEKLKRAVDSVFAMNTDAIGFTVHVEAPDQRVSWSYAVGKDGKSSLQPLNASQPVLIASNTKPYVAASILRLEENKKLNIKDPIANYLGEYSRSELRKAGYRLDSITIKQLLSHTSGIRDYVDEGYFQFISENKQHQWTRDEQISRAASLGNPLAKPGEAFHYADVNYVLLTEIIENSTHRPFYKSMGKLLGFNKLDLESTWFVQLEKKPKKAGEMVHQHWSRFSWQIDSLNPSWDLYGGGGMASTTKEMAMFFQQLFNGKIIRDSAVLALMSEDVPPDLEVNYCLGIRKIKAYGFVEYNHGGGLGTDVVYIPELNASIAIGSVEASKRPVAVDLSKELVRILSKP